MSNAETEGMYDPEGWPTIGVFKVDKEGESWLWEPGTAKTTGLEASLKREYRGRRIIQEGNVYFAKWPLIGKPRKVAEVKAIRWQDAVK